MVVPHSDECIFVTMCNEPFSICALGYVTSSPRKVLPSCKVFPFISKYQDAAANALAKPGRLVTCCGPFQQPKIALSALFGLLGGWDNVLEGLPYKSNAGACKECCVIQMGHRQMRRS